MANPQNATVRTNVSNQTIEGTANDDIVALIGTGNNNYITLGQGNDEAFTSNTTGPGYVATTVIGGSGNDLFGSSNSGQTFGDVGGFGSNSLLLGNTGNDSFTLDQPDARGITVFGGQGDDIFDIEAGTNHLIFGNIGSEIIDISALTNGSTSVFGGQDNDAIRGSNGGNDFLSGDIGNDDIVLGTGGNSLAFGGAGNDVFAVNGTNDATVTTTSSTSGGTTTSTADDFSTVSNTIFGGQGNDYIGGTLITTTTTAGETITALAPGGDNGASLEGLVFGNKGTDTIIINGASSDDASIFGGQDNDIIAIDGNDDGNGNNVADGELLLSGDAGNDQLSAAGPDVTMTGGSGIDTFYVAGSVADDDENVTLITDFQTGVDFVSFGDDPAIQSGNDQNYREFTELDEDGGYQDALDRISGIDDDNLLYAFVQTKDGSFLFHRNDDAADGFEAVQLGNLTTAQFQASDISSAEFVVPEPTAFNIPNSGFGNPGQIED